jgi:hypothetical protein
VLGDEPDWEKWKNPEDLYNKVHFNIDPPEPGENEESEAPPSEPEDFQEEEFAEFEEVTDDFSEPDEDEENSPEEIEYSEIADRAVDFASRVMQLENLPEDASVLYLSAGKIGANLAGGHGLGYDDQMLCGNIVKCRWALSDCEFCEQMLEFHHKRTGENVLQELIVESRILAAAIRTRIETLRARVWWQGK